MEKMTTQELLVLLQLLTAPSYFMTEDDRRWKSEWIQNRLYSERWMKR